MEASLVMLILEVFEARIEVGFNKGLNDFITPIFTFKSSLTA